MLELGDKDLKRTHKYVKKLKRNDVQNGGKDWEFGGISILKLKDLKEHLIEIPSLKHIISKIKKSLGRLNNELDTAKERIDVLEQINRNYAI